MRQKVGRRHVSGERLVAHGRVNERRRSGEHGGETEGARCAALFLGIGRRLVMVAVARVRFHFRAAIRFDHFKARHLGGQGGERDRRTNRQANERAQDRFHFFILGGAVADRKRAGGKINPVSYREK